MGKDMVLDVHQGAEVFGGDKELYHSMMVSFHATVLEQNITNISNFMLKRLWLKLKQEVHSMKGSCGYISAQQCQASCKSLQESSLAMHEKGQSYNQEDLQKVYNDFMNLMESSKTLNQALNFQLNTHIDDSVYNKLIQEIKQDFEKNDQEIPLIYDKQNNKQCECCVIF